MRFRGSWMRTSLGGVFAASLFLNVQHWSAPPAAPEPAPVPAAFRDAAAEELDPAQKEALLRYGEECSRREGELAREAARLKEELLSLLAAEVLDDDRVRAVARSLGRCQQESLENCIETVLRVRQSLTPAQFAALRSCCATDCDPLAGTCAPGVPESSPGGE